MHVLSMGWVLNQIQKKYNPSNEAHANVVAGPVENIEIAQAEYAPTFNGMLWNMRCESHYLENDLSKKMFLAMCIRLKIGNEHFDHENIEVHANQRT